MDSSTIMDCCSFKCGRVCCENEAQWKPLLAAVQQKIKRSLLKFEQFYLDMKFLPVMVNQLVFFCLCERAFMVQQPAISFYMMMLLHVITYCVTYVKELIERDDWSIFVRIAKKSNACHLAVSITKLVLEWTKAVTFVTTVSLMLLTFGVKKCLSAYSPGIPYIILTSLYYILSEKVFVDIISQGLEWSKFECFESMENLYSPLILKSLQMALSFIFTVACGLLGNVKLTVLSCLTNLRIRYKDIDDNHWRPLIQELIRLMRFRSADKEEILFHNDVCAICLQEMKTARVTPCNHFFHADCLRRCLNDTYNYCCPLCKRSLQVSNQQELM